jgi:hypothetical protein
MTRRLTILLTCGALILSPGPVVNQSSFRGITVATSEVTTPALTTMPDGALVFSALGHLFRLPADGGTATSLTTGQSFDFARRFRRTDVV